MEKPNHQTSVYSQPITSVISSPKGIVLANYQWAAAYFRKSRVVMLLLVNVSTSSLTVCVCPNTHTSSESITDVHMIACDSRTMRFIQDIYLRIVLKLFLLFCILLQGEGRETESFVTCGSVVKLINTKHNVRLHSHDVKYGSGRLIKVVSDILTIFYSQLICCCLEWLFIVGLNGTVLTITPFVTYST